MGGGTWIRPRGGPILVLVAALIAAAATGAQAAPPRPALHARPTRDQAEAARLLNRADAYVQRTDPTCPFDAFATPSPVQLSDGTPSRQLLATLAVLRRPATPTELNLFGPGQGPPPLSQTVVYRRSTRIVDGPDGFRATLTVGLTQEQRPALLYQPHCRRERIAKVRQFLSTGPTAVRTRVLRIVRMLMRVRPVPIGPQEFLSLGLALPGGGAVGIGGTFDLSAFRRSGIGISSSRSVPLPSTHGRRRRLPPPRSTFTAVVPDGVATVTIHYPKASGRSRSGPYAHAYTVTARVRSNTVFFTRIPRIIQDPGGLITWRTGAGRVIRTNHL